MPSGPAIAGDSALKRKEVLTPAATQMNLEDALLSERSHTKADKFGVIPLTGGPSKRQIQIQKVEGWLQGLGERSEEQSNGTEFLFCKMKSLEFEDGVGDGCMVTGMQLVPVLCTQEGLRWSRLRRVLLLLLFSCSLVSNSFITP